MKQNFTCFLTMIIYITVVLTAMQVRLGKLRENAAFNRASYGFTVFAILDPLILGLFVGATLVVLVCFNLSHALDRRKKMRMKYGHIFDSDSTLYKH